MGTRNWLARAWRGASGSVMAMTRAKSAPWALVTNHLWPFSRHPPSGRAVAAVLIQTGLEPACSGSVMAKQLRISPRTRGSRNRSCCAGVACRSRISMLPASGAWQLKAAWARGLWPSRSLTWANSDRDRPTPSRWRGSWKFHRPCARCARRSCISDASTASGPRRRKSASSGRMSSARTRSSRARNSAVAGAGSMDQGGMCRGAITLDWPRAAVRGPSRPCRFLVRRSGRGAI